jgi:hypothetical protein
MFQKLGEFRHNTDKSKNIHVQREKIFMKDQATTTEYPSHVNKYKHENYRILQ